MKYMFSIAIVVLLLLTSCSQPTPSTDLVATAIAQTLAAQASPSVIPSNTPEITPIPKHTNTPVPSRTPKPTKTAAPTEAPVSGAIIAKNFVASQDSGGVVVEIARILIAEKDAVDQDFSQSSLFDDKPVVVEIIFRITNNNDKIINIYTDQGKAVVNNEQIELIDYAFEGAEFGDEFSGEIYPGATVVGGIWFGLKRVPFTEVNKIIIGIDHPRDNDYNRLGPDYYIEIEVKDWIFEPLPDGIL